MANKAILLSIFMIFATICEVQADSSGCPGGKDKDVMEKLIHSNKSLSEADEMLNKEYKAALQTYPYKGELKSNQDHWIWHGRYECDDWCTNVPCLVKLYRDRIAEVRAQYSTYFYGGDKLTGEYGRKYGSVSVILMPGKKIKFYINTVNYQAHLCTIGMDGDAVATLVDKHHAIFSSDVVEECILVLTFGKNIVMVDSVTPGCYGYCGLNAYMEGDYFKKSKKPSFPPFSKIEEKNP